MMSILIKGMEIPKGCASCFLKYGSCSSMRKRMGIKGDRWCPENYRHPDCPLVEVSEDVQPVKHGQWLDSTYKYSEYNYDCSVCGCNEYRQVGKNGRYRAFKYCPECGADMRGVDNG